MLKIRILFVGSQALALVIEHLFRDRQDFQVLHITGGLAGLADRSDRRLPALIVADIRPVSTGVCQAVASVKRCSPSSKLIIICPITGLLSIARKCGADACLEPDALVPSLLPTALALSQRPRRRALSA